jgi:hypothetical protein
MGLVSHLPTVDPHLQSKDHKKWALAVMRRAGYRCEWNEGGVRCEKASIDGHRLHADHIKERRDFPELAMALENGQCLCTSHHVTKTHRERAKRMAAR